MKLCSRCARALRVHGVSFYFDHAALRIFFEFVDKLALYLHEIHAGVHADMMPTATAASGILSESRCSVLHPYFLLFQSPVNMNFVKPFAPAAWMRKSLMSFSPGSFCHDYYPVFSLNRCMLRIFILSLNLFSASTLMAIK